MTRSQIIKNAKARQTRREIARALPGFIGALAVIGFIAALRIALSI